jgi:hypothetical protein
MHALDWVKLPFMKGPCHSMSILNLPGPCQCFSSLVLVLLVGETSHNRYMTHWLQCKFTPPVHFNHSSCRSFYYFKWYSGTSSCKSYLNSFKSLIFLLFHCRSLWCCLLPCWAHLFLYLRVHWFLSDLIYSATTFPPLSTWFNIHSDIISNSLVTELTSNLEQDTAWIIQETLPD